MLKLYFWTFAIAFYVKNYTFLSCDLINNGYLEKVIKKVKVIGTV